MPSVVGLIASHGSRVNPEVGLTLTSSFPVGSIADASVSRLLNAAFAFELTWPASFTADAFLWEQGGTGTGSGLGLINSGSTLRLSAGDGGLAPFSSPTVTATVDVPTTNFVPGSSGTLAWDIQINPGRVRLWWQGILLAVGNTSTNGPLENSAWSGSDSGQFGSITASSLATGFTNTAFTGTFDSNLRYYNNQLILI